MTQNPAPVPVLRYHQMSRLLPGRWRPLAALPLAALLLLGLFVVALVALVVAGMVQPGVAAAIDRSVASDTLDAHDPVNLALMLGTIALAVPACRACVRLLGSPGILDSVAGRIRWRLMLRACVLTAAVLLVAATVAVATSPAMPRPNPPAIASSIVALTLVPFQAAGEEYIFRGLLPQVVGRWLRSPVWGAVVAVPLFVAGHGYDAAGLVATAGFALGASYLVWRTGGLEVVIAWHLVNNLNAFAMELVGLSDPTAPVTWGAAAMDLAVSATLVAAMELAWRRRWCEHFTATRPAVAAVGNRMPPVTAAERMPVVAATRTP